MAQVRPKILLRYGRQNEPVRIPISDLLVDSLAATFLDVNTSSGIATLTVKNITGFAINQILLIGDPGNQGSEIIITHASVAPTGTTITLASNTLFPHSAGTPIRVINFDKVQVLNAPTVGGTKSILSTLNLVANSPTTDYNDVISTGGYYFAFFLQSLTKTITITRSGTTATATSTAHGFVTGNLVYISGANQSDYNGIFTVTRVDANTFTFQVANSPTTPATGTIVAALASPYSDPVPYASYVQLSARSLIDNALGMINKETSEVLTDEYGFQNINNCQQEVLRELKRWSFLQMFDVSLGQVTTGQWKVAVPTDLDDQNTNKSIYNFKIGTLDSLMWVDKAKWNEIIAGVSHTTLAVAIAVNDPTITLVDASNFPDGGTLYIGSNTYQYTSINRTTNVVTLTSISTTTNTINSDVFSGASFGTPLYWTIFGGFLYFYPVLSTELNQREAMLDYYKAPVVIYNDSDLTVLSDPNVIIYYLAWKFLLKLNSGVDDASSQSMKINYIERKNILKQKEVIGRTFKLKPILNTLNESGDVDNRQIRTGNFPNTGF